MPTNKNQSKQSNYSMDFDGANNDHIVTSSNVGISGSQSRTMSVWIKGGSANNTKNWPMAVAFGAGSTANAMWIGGGANPGVYWAFGWWGVSQDIYTSIRIDADEDWHMLTSTYDESTQIAKGYFDGVEVASVTRTGINTTNSPLIIGKHLTDSTYWDGQIDGVSIFDYALSQSQVTTLYGNSTNGVGNPMALPSPPIAYYPLGGSAGAFRTPVNVNDQWLIENNAIGDYVFDFIPNDYIQIPSTTNFAFGTSGFTISLWVNFDALTSGGYNILDFRTSGSGTTVGSLYGLILQMV